MYHLLWNCRSLNLTFPEEFKGFLFSLAHFSRLRVNFMLLSDYLKAIFTFPIKWQNFIQTLDNEQTKIQKPAKKKYFSHYEDFWNSLSLSGTTGEVKCAYPNCNSVISIHSLISPLHCVRVRSRSLCNSPQIKILIETKWDAHGSLEWQQRCILLAPDKNFTSPPLQRGSVWFLWERQNWIQPQHVQSTSDIFTLTWINVLRNWWTICLQKMPDKY